MTEEEGKAEPPPDESGKKAALTSAGLALWALGYPIAPLLVQVGIAIRNTINARAGAVFKEQLEAALEEDRKKFFALLQKQENRSEEQERRLSTVLKLITEAGTHPEPDFQRAKSRLAARVGLCRLSDLEGLQAAAAMDSMTGLELSALQIVHGYQSRSVSVDGVTWRGFDRDPDLRTHDLPGHLGSAEAAVCMLLRRRHPTLQLDEESAAECIARAVAAGVLKNLSPQQVSGAGIPPADARLRTTAIGRLVADQFRMPKEQP